MTRFFIERPVATTLMMISLLFTGVIGYSLLPVASLPEVEYPTLQIQTSYPGASPEVITTTITAPLERQLGQIAGLKQMLSTSSLGLSLITLQFSLDRSLDVAQQDVQAAINLALSYLPKDLPYPPFYSKINPADPPVLILSITSLKRSIPQLADFVETRFIQKISQIAGVGLVSVTGGSRPAFHIQVNPTALAYNNLSMNDIQLAITKANNNQAKGNLDGPRLAYTIDTNSQLLTIQDYQELILAFNNKAPLRLKDVATIVEESADRWQAAWVDRKPALVVSIQKQPGANVIKVASKIKNFIEHSIQAFPEDIDVNILSDRTLSIRSSINHAAVEMIFAVLLVVMVIYLFLGDLSATLIPSTSVPLSLIGGAGFMYLLGFSLNNLTLMSMIIATGFVIDDAIVMIENIRRHLEDGSSPLVAAIQGSRQITFTVISLSCSLIAVMLPLFLMDDVIGRLFKEFAYTLAIIILLSAFVTLTYIPMLCAYRLKPAGEQPVFVSRLISIYHKHLEVVFKHQRIVLIGTVLIFVSSIYLLITIPKGFFPQQDLSLITAIAELSPQASFKMMSIEQDKIAKIILNHSSVQTVIANIGVDRLNTSLNKARFSIVLNRSDRRQSIDKVMSELKNMFSQETSAQLRLASVQDVVLDSKALSYPYRLSVTGSDPCQVHDASQLLTEALAQDKIFEELELEDHLLVDQLLVHIDRERVSQYGLTVKDVDDLLYSSFGQRQVSTIYTQTNQYFVILEAAADFQKTLNDCYLKNSHGKSIPLAEVVTLLSRKTPLVINRQDQFPLTSLSFNLAKTASLDRALNHLDHIVNKLPLPKTITVQAEGLAQIFQNSLANEQILFLASVCVVYLILGILYESFVQPLIILSTLPSASLGALLALNFSGLELSLVALIGILLVIGIVMKNAIMMIDFALELEREHHLSSQVAITQACLLRFRPIVMTTACAMIGALPLMIGGGVGAELRQPLGIVIFGGLTLSQLLTLFTTPVVYLSVNNLLMRSKRNI